VTAPEAERHDAMRLGVVWCRHVECTVVPVVVAVMCYGTCHGRTMVHVELKRRGRQTDDREIGVVECQLERRDVP